MKRCTIAGRVLWLRVTDEYARALFGMRRAVNLGWNYCSDPMQTWSVQKITGSAA